MPTGVEHVTATGILSSFVEIDSKKTNKQTNEQTNIYKQNTKIAMLIEGGNRIDSTYILLLLPRDAL